MMSGLWQRVITAAVLIPLIVWAVLELRTLHVAVIFGAVVVAAGWEWSGLASWRRPIARRAYALAFAPLLYTAYLAAERPTAVVAVLVAGALWWGVALLLVLRFQHGAETPPRRFAPVIGVVAGWLVLVPAWLAVVFLHGIDGRGPWLVLFLLVLVWVADSGAYMVGRRWGVTRLAPRLSPGKTWEGALGGLLAAGVLAAVGAAYLQSGVGDAVLFVILCLGAVAVSILGDLVESLIKRQAGVKDSGTLLPGHGGVLDRIDSLTAAAPIFALGVYWLEGVT